MPTYEFECDKCGHRFEIMQGMNDPAPKKCPDCGKTALRKVFHPVGIIYKGSGFYATDYAKKDQEANAAARSAEKEAGEKAAPGKEQGPSAPKEGTEKPATSDKTGDAAAAKPGAKTSSGTDRSGSGEAGPKGDST